MSFKVDPVVTARRKRVLALADGSRSIAEIGAILGVTSGAIDQDLLVLRKAGHSPKIRPRGKVKSALSYEERLKARVKKRWATHCVREIAKSAGIPQHRVRAIANEMELGPEHPDPVQRYVPWPAPVGMRPEQIAWAMKQPPDNLEARLILKMAAE